MRPFAQGIKGGSDLLGKSMVKIAPQASCRLCWKQSGEQTEGHGI